MSYNFKGYLSEWGVSSLGTTLYGADSAAICSVPGFHFSRILSVGTDGGRKKREPGFGLSLEFGF